MFLRQIFDPYLAQYAYLIGCQKTGEALIIDPERDIDRYRKIAKENDLRITAVAETHIHADFVSGSREFSTDPDVHIYLSGEGGADWQYKWPEDRPNTHIIKDGDIFNVGNIQIQAVHSPGHTPEHLSYLITDIGGGADKPMALATGDFVFVGDVGRPDLLESAAGMKDVMKPSAKQLCASLNQKLANLEDWLQILPGHGAGSACGKSLGAVPSSTLGYERLFNNSLKKALSNEAEFINFILSDQPEPPPYFATMKRVNRDGIKITGGLPQVNKLSQKEFSDAFDNQNLKVLDTREDRILFDQLHLKNAISAPLHSSFFSVAAGSYLEEDDSILLCLENENDLDLAVRQLYRIGFDNIIGWVTFADVQNNQKILSSIERVNFNDFDPKTALERGEILDVRTSAEFQQKHIEGAKLLPYTRLKESLDQINKNSLLYIHCGTGKRASLAASFLKSRGYQVRHIDGVCSECNQISEDIKVPH